MRDLLSPKDNVETLCSNAEVIKSLNETKQYTLMATGLLESVITDPNLTAAAAKLWEYLYSKAIMNDKICIKVRYKDLADKFSRSERTIKRHVEDLKENGYLYVESNFNYRGQRANTFYLQIPQAIIDNLKNTKDRKIISQKDHTFGKKSSNRSKFQSKTHGIHLKETPLICASEDNKSKTIISVLPDKDVTPDHDTNVTLNNNIKKAILLNNNSVVVAFQNNLESQKSDGLILNDENSEIAVLNATLGDISDNTYHSDQQKIEEIEETINTLYIKMGNIKGHDEKTKIFDAIRILQENISTIILMMNKRKQATELRPEETNRTRAGKSTYQADPTVDYMQVTGERKLSIADISRIKKYVEKSAYQTDFDKVCNEIIYAIRFGALRTAQNGDFLSIAHAVSIALKLVRERRWETPAPMQRSEKLGFSSLRNENSYFQKRLCHGHQHIGGLLQPIGQSCA